jgi:hypothetical protein
MEAFSTAELGRSAFALSSLSAVRKNGENISVLTKDGALTLETVSQKKLAVEAAKAALFALKNPQTIAYADYADQTSKAETAAAKVTDAYNKGAIVQNIGQDLLDVLAAVQRKLEEMRPYFDALEVLNQTSGERVDAALKENAAYFFLDEDIISFYESFLQDKSVVQQKIEGKNLSLPTAVAPYFYEQFALSAVYQTNWGHIGTVLTALNHVLNLCPPQYFSLSDTAKASVHRSIAKTDFLSADAMRDAVFTAVTKAAANTPSYNPGIGGGGGGGGGLTVKSDEPLVAPNADIPAEQLPPSYQNKPFFSDLIGYEWARDATLYLAEKGVISGDGEGLYRPGDGVLREEFTKLLALGLQIKTPDGKTAPFSDVEQGAWYEESVYALSAAGIVKGNGNGCFGTGSFITREDMAVMLNRAALRLNISAPLLYEPIFWEDGGEISDYALQSVETLQSMGVINGFEDNTFRPREKATRAMAAKVVYEMCEMYETIRLSGMEG